MKDKTLALCAPFLVILACRLLPHSAGFTPIISASFLLTYFFGWRAMLAACLANLCADSVLGFYDSWSMIGTYAGHLVAGSTGLWAKGRLALAGGLMSSLAFFTLSNFGVWLGSSYGFTGQGLASCYVMAIPFWKTQLCADVLVVGLVAVLMLASEAKTAPPRRAGLRAGFTLIELLVVLAIIAVLAAILFPVFSQAKASAKKTVALTYVRQLGLATTLYASDWDDGFVRDLTPGSGKTYYWWGSWDGSTLKIEEGPLYPYTKSKGVQADPTFPDSFRTAVGLTGFGYNYAYLSPSDYDANWNPVPRPVTMTQAQSPSQTLMFASSARIGSKLEGNPFIDPPSYFYPGIHARHAGDKAVIVWVDGHASALGVQARDSYPYGLSASEVKKNRLGDILAPGCGFGSACEDSLYDLE